MSRDNDQNGDDWRAADALFDRLLDLPREQWAALVAAQPAAVRGPLQRLVAAHESSGPLDNAMTASPLSGVVPESIGAWRRGEEIGRGGMSVVYRAERQLGDVIQVAALKLLTVSALAADGRRHLQREHQALARLQHPGIVPLLDAGVLDDGTPYLAMPLVEGERIDRYCAGRQLPASEVITLFRQVCDAVAYAHRRLVIHRDLKPGNILVDGSGHVHLLDFGIARLLDSGLDGEATATQMRALTPQYAAPEQFSGAGVGTAVDVFGLGAVLYQLLTGRPPRLSASERHDTLTLPSRAAAKNEALDASRRQVLSRQLHGDLDAILMKALADDPERRYPDAAALDADLRRWQLRRPVRAVPAGAMYRFRKFAQRHRGAMAVTSLLVLAILGGLAGTLWQAQVAATQAARANHEAARSIQVRDFLVQLFDAANPEREGGAISNVHDLLAKSRADLQADRSLPEDLRADFEAVLGDITAKAGDLGEGRALLARAQQRAAALPGQFDLAQRLRLQRADLEYRAGNYHEAEEQAAAVIAALDSQGEALPRLRSRALADRAIARSAHDPGERQVMRWLSESLTLAQSLDPPDAAFVARRLFNLAQAQREAGHFAEAEGYLQQAASLAADAPGMPASFRLSLDWELSSTLMRVGKPQEALAAGDRALALARSMYPAGHYRVAQSLSSHGLLQSQLGNLAAAERELSQAVAMLRAQPGISASRLATPLFNLATVQDDIGHHADAAANLAEVQRMDEAEFGPLHGYVLSDLTWRAALLEQAGDPMADALFDDAAERFSRLPSDRPWSIHVETAVIRYADHLRLRGRPVEALAWADRAISQHAARDDRPDPTLVFAQTVRMLAVAQGAGDGDIDAAEHRALLTAEACPDERAVDLSRFYLEAAQLRWQRGEQARARSMFDAYERRRGAVAVPAKWQAMHQALAAALADARD